MNYEKIINKSRKIDVFYGFGEKPYIENIMDYNGFPRIPEGDPWIPWGGIPWGDRWDLGTDGTLGPMGPGPQGPPIIKLDIDFIKKLFIDIRLPGPGAGYPAAGPATLRKYFWKKSGKII